MTVIPLQLKPGDAAQKAGVQEQVLLMIGICTEIRRRFCPFRSAQGARGQTAGHLQKILNIARVDNLTDNGNLTKLFIIVDFLFDVAVLDFNVFILNLT